MLSIPVVDDWVFQKDKHLSQQLESKLHKAFTINAGQLGNSGRSGRSGQDLEM